MILVVYCINANTTALLIRAALDKSPLFGAQILDFNGQIWLKFECNGIKKSWTEIRTALFYLCQYGMLPIVLSTILRKAPQNWHQLVSVHTHILGQNFEQIKFFRYYV